MCCKNEHMDLQIALRYSYANFLTKKRYDHLNAKFGTLESAIASVNSELLQSLGCRKDTIETVLHRWNTFDAAIYAAQLQKKSIVLLTIEDVEYPALLKNVPDAPVFLYIAGAVETLSQTCIALVGTRNMSPYGQRVTEYFVPSLVNAQIVTVSGLAYGIDACVANETLKAKGKTVAVIGAGLAQITPMSHRYLAQRIIAGGGALVSEFPLDVPASTYTFPARNRIIAGISMGTIVLEAGHKSGAAITANLAFDYNRDVFAVPGQIFDDNYVGTHALIHNQIAQLVTSPAEVLAVYGRKDTTEASVFVPSNTIETTIYNALTALPQTIEQLHSKSTLDIATLIAHLTIIELANGAKNLGNGEWVKL